ncbi:hypothetical protein TCE0_038f12562 [Talaromyces pinophilus]|uniref:BZIP domain-containing protein n=1 Tax=Talaromyces pinophilus TaxID=128442 RepID=A0A0B8MY27_TALPI|nr:hypothetical protein TCE0_038f12562 [Talaromyces pinophilus]
MVNDDNWTGLTDAQARRRRQNRLNQRARRRRKEQVKLSRESTTSSEIDNRARMIMLSATSRERPFYFPLSTDYLLTLVHFNVFRALLTNMTILSLPCFFSCEEPKTTIACLSTPLLEITTLPDKTVPPTLIPTPLQRSIPHEAWIDLFPLPALRDNLIRLRGMIDECDLCDDILGTMYDEEVSRHDERDGMIVWGEPWDVYSWELMEGFVKKWACMLVGCDELIDSTNRWRVKRGEEPLVVDVSSRI